MTVEDLEQNRSNAIKDYFQQSSHPIAAFFFLFFRVGAMATYLLGSFFLDNFTFVFVLCILQLAFDFWTVKNISGRLLVGLRWWNEIQPDGTNKWVFESANPDRKPNDTDSRLFWSVLYITPLLWMLFGFTCVLTMKPSWLIIVLAAIVLSGANLYGYTQCDKDARKRNWSDHSSFLGSSSLMTTSILGRVVRGGLGRFI